MQHLLSFHWSGCRGKAVSVATLLAIVSPAIAGPRAEALARCQAIQDGIQRRDCFQALKGKMEAAPPVPPAQDGARDDPATTSAIDRPAPPVPSVRVGARDDPATTSAIDRPGAAVGQTFCADRDALAAMLVAGVLASSPDDVTTKGCQTIPEDAQVQVLERYPSDFHLLRTVKVQITVHSLPDPKIGYTIEIGR
jgi:hypothetical protein